jgi:hypothetical protein
VRYKIVNRIVGVANTAIHKKSFTMRRFLMFKPNHM